MLYVTTRTEREYYPALRPLGYDLGPDGGMYVPHRLPVYDQAAIAALKEKSFGTCVADVLTQLFVPGLSGAEVDFTIGRCPVNLKYMSHRIAVAECWHNPHWNFEWVVHTLTQRIRAESQQRETITEWAGIAVRIAVLFGIFGQLQHDNQVDFEHPADVAVGSDDFTWPMATWYARAMGLPIGNIICCGENSAAWDLITRGELRVGDGAGVPMGLERLIAATLGPEEACRYRDTASVRGIYTPQSDQFEQLRQGMAAAVVSKKRMERTVASVYRTNAYILSPESAILYAGLQDYRATAGESRITLIPAEINPADRKETIAAVLGISAEALNTKMEQE